MAIFFALGIFLTTYKLTETPPTWMDEGIIIQVARNIWLNGRVELQSAPGTFETGWYVTTSYPVTFPIAIAFDVFGQSLLVARSIMVAYLVLLIVSVFVFTQLLARYHNAPARFVAGSTVAIIVSFAALYGHGKNVLGEIPGMFWLVVAATVGLLYTKIENACGKATIVFGAGVALGLAVATKPIYILALIAAVAGSISFVVYEYVRTLDISFKKYLGNFLLMLGGIFAPLYVWFNHQFNHQSFSSVWSVYFNPHHNELASAVVHNAILFITEIQPFHVLALFIIWSAGLYVLVSNKKRVSIMECIAWFLSLGVLVAFLRTAGYYRYFFIAQFISLVFFSISVWRLDVFVQGVFLNKVPQYILKYGKFIAIALLVAVQMYYMVSYSWINAYKDSTRSLDLERWAQSLPDDSKVFLYQAPEVATFLSSHEYYQYMKITQSLIVGEGVIVRAKDEGVDYIVLPQGYSQEVFPEANPLYFFDTNVSRYEIWKRK